MCDRLITLPAFSPPLVQNEFRSLRLRHSSETLTHHASSPLQTSVYHPCPFSLDLRVALLLSLRPFAGYWTPIADSVLLDTTDRMHRHPFPISSGFILTPLLATSATGIVALFGQKRCGRAAFVPENFSRGPGCENRSSICSRYHVSPARGLGIEGLSSYSSLYLTGVTPLPTLLTIAGSDPSGGAGIQVSTAFPSLRGLPKHNTAHATKPDDTFYPGPGKHYAKKPLGLVCGPVCVSTSGNALIVDNRDSGWRSAVLGRPDHTEKIRGRTRSFAQSGERMWL